MPCVGVHQGRETTRTVTDYHVMLLAAPLHESLWGLLLDTWSTVAGGWEDSSPLSVQRLLQIYARSLRHLQRTLG
jgi:hypothetical protein